MRFGRSWIAKDPVRYCMFGVRYVESWMTGVDRRVADSGGVDLARSPGLSNPGSNGPYRRRIGNQLLLGMVCSRFSVVADVNLIIAGSVIETSWPGPVRPGE